MLIYCLGMCELSTFPSQPYFGIRFHWLSRYNFNAWQVKQTGFTIPTTYQQHLFIPGLKSFCNVLNGNFLGCLWKKINYSLTYFLNGAKLAVFNRSFPLEKLFKQPCSNAEGWKLSFCFTAVKRLLRSTHMWQNVESWACYWQTCKASGLSQLKRVSESTSIFIDLKCSEDWLVTRSFIFNSHDRWPQRFENNTLYCYLLYIASACLF